MKTKLQLASIALLGLMFTSCSSSVYMSKSTVAPSDDIYFTPRKTITAIATSNSTPTANSNEYNSQNSSKISQLEKKYSDVSLLDTTNTDTLATKIENQNPYQRVLSDSYQDSYERRMRGMEDPRYGMENFSDRYSDDYFYASSYDPALYNIVVMGDQVWVEPWYISSLFWQPRNHFSLNFGFGFGFGYGWNSWGWNPWYSNYCYNPYMGINSWYSNWNPYYGYGNPYYGYNNNIYNNNLDYFGKRPNISTMNTAQNLRSGNSYENRIAIDRRNNDNSSVSITRRNNNNTSIIRTRNTPQNEVLNRNQGTNNNTQEVVRRNNRTGDMNTTRLKGDGVNRSGTNITEPTRRSSNNTYQRPRPTTNDEYIRPSTRNQNTNNNSSNKEGNTRSTTTTREVRNSTPTYNSPNRVGTSTTRERTTSSGSSVRESKSSGTSSSSGSSSAGSNTTTNTSSGSSSNSSSGSNNRRR